MTVVSASALSQQQGQDCLVMFPTIAVPDEREKAWRILIRGWIFRRDPQSRKVRMVNATLRTLLGIRRGSREESILRHHVSYFFAPGLPDQPISIKLQGFFSGVPDVPCRSSSSSSSPLSSNGQLPYTGSLGQTPSFTEARTGQLIDLESPEAPEVETYRPTPPPKPTRKGTQQDLACDDGGGGDDARRVPPPPPPKPKRLVASHQPGSGTFNGIAEPVIPHSSTSQQPRLATEYHDKGTIPSPDQNMMDLLDGFQEKTLSSLNGEILGEIMVGFNEMEWLMQKNGGGHGLETLKLQAKAPQSQCHPSFCRVHVIPNEGISVISDIDDTVKTTNIADGKMAVLTATFAKPFLAIDGMAELYRTWQALGASFHYVSNSPWRLYPMLESFFWDNQFPLGSFHLRNFDMGEFSSENYKGTMENKMRNIDTLIRRFPRRKFVLVGDSGEWDLQIYTSLARRYPGQIVKIFIRDLFVQGFKPRPLSQAPVPRSFPVANATAPPLPPRSSVYSSARSTPASLTPKASSSNMIDLESRSSTPTRPALPNPSTKPAINKFTQPPAINSGKGPLRDNTLQHHSTIATSDPRAEVGPPKAQRDQQFELAYSLCISASSFYASPVGSSELLQRLEKLCNLMSDYAEARAHYNSHYTSQTSMDRQSDQLSQQQQQQKQKQQQQPPPLPYAGSYWADIFAHVDQRQFKMWQDYEMLTHGLPPSMCKFFVDASDITDQLN